MTDRINAVIVVLDKDIREDDAKALLAAISQFKGVVSVEGNVSDISSHIAYTRARHDLGSKLWDALYPKKESST